MPDPLSPEDLRLIDAWWRAANYLTVGQIYLQYNPLLREPLRREHIKPRLLGHWGTRPGLNFLYAHLNRLIRRDRFPAIYLAGRVLAHAQGDEAVRVAARAGVASVEHAFLANEATLEILACTRSHARAGPCR